MDNIINQLPVYLFWDSDRLKLNDIEHYEKIITRTFEFGDIEHMAIVIDYYGREICSEALKSAEY